jgi:hypothetical protein
MKIDIRDAIEIDSFYMNFEPPETEELTTEDLEDIDRSDECKVCGHQNEEICNTCDAR